MIKYSSKQFAEAHFSSHLIYGFRVQSPSPHGTWPLQAYPWLEVVDEGAVDAAPP